MKKLSLSVLIALLWLGSTGSMAKQTHMAGLSIAVVHVINAGTAEYNDVAAALSAAKPGDSVVIPEGRAVWAQQLVIDKGIGFYGAGKDKTFITAGWDRADDSMSQGNFMLLYRPLHPELNEKLDMANMTLDTNSRALGVQLCNTSTKPINKVKVHGCRIIEPNGRRVLAVSGLVWGVAYECELTGMITTYGSNASWGSLTYAFGTADQFYYEDCIISNTGPFHDSGAGARWCARHNKYYYTKTTANQAPGFDWHGNLGTDGNSSVFGVEGYENSINTGSRAGGMPAARGGKALWYNNAIVTTSTGSYSPFVREEYLDNSRPFPFAVDGQPQHVSDTYVWNNTQNGVVKPVYLSGHLDYPGLGHVPRPDREWFRENPLFNGSPNMAIKVHSELWNTGTFWDETIMCAGIGVGLLAKRPARCTVEGAAWWATDKKCLYRWHANQWESFYKPLAYPHPLRLAS